VSCHSHQRSPDTYVEKLFLQAVDARDLAWKVIVAEIQHMRYRFRFGDRIIGLPADTNGRRRCEGETVRGQRASYRRNCITTGIWLQRIAVGPFINSGEAPTELIPSVMDDVPGHTRFHSRRRPCHQKGDVSTPSFCAASTPWATWRRSGTAIVEGMIQICLPFQLAYVEGCAGRDKLRLGHSFLDFGFSPCEPSDLAKAGPMRRANAIAARTSKWRARIASVM